MSLSYDKLIKICHGLNIEIAQLFADDAITQPVKPKIGGRRSITRAGKGYSIETPNYLYLYQAADLLNKHFIPMVGEVHARSIQEFGELIRHPGEEYALVLEGVVDIYSDLYAPTRLETGDSIYFDSGMAHAYVAVSPGKCRILSICSAEEDQFMQTNNHEEKLSVTQQASSSPAVFEKLVKMVNTGKTNPKSPKRARSK